MNQAGIPMPLLRDPKVGVSSLSFTLVVVAALNVQLALINLFANFVKGVDVTNALYWFGMCSALYFGRSIVSSKDKIEINAEKKE